MATIIHGTPDGNRPQREQKSFEQFVFPPGSYDFEIVKSQERTHQYSVSDSNPDGHEISLWLDAEIDGKRRRMFDSIALTKVWRLNQVLRAAGLPTIDAKVGSINESCLEGARVRARVYHTGSGRAKIGDYLPTKPAVKPANSSGGMTAQPRHQDFDPTENAIPF